MVAPTIVRAGRVTALLLGVQSAKGTPTSDFTTGAAGRVWTDVAEIDASPLKSDAGGFMTQPEMETLGRYTVPAQREGGISVKATYTALSWLLRNNWGSFSAGSFTLKSQINEWLTLGWVESVVSGSTEYFYRIYDAWIHVLTLRANPFSPLMVNAEYSAERDSTPQALNALSGITLPTAPMTAADRQIFPGRLVRFIRDPLGANVEFDLSEIEISIDQGLGSNWDMLQQVPNIWKTGYPGPRVQVTFSGHVSLETWAILTNSRAGTKQRYRMIATAPGGTLRTLQMDFYEMDFEVQPVGHVGQRYVQFVARGTAHRDSSGNFVTISLT